MLYLCRPTQFVESDGEYNGQSDTM